MELREYQKNIILETRKNLLQHKKICIQAPCGSGKSVILAKIIKDTTDKGNRVLFLVHRKELMEQAYERFNEFKIEIIRTNFNDYFPKYINKCFKTFH